MIPAVVAGAALLAWPALVNGYPLLFSDTGAFLYQALAPFMVWDKPWVYGPLLLAFDWRITLWGPVAAQCLALAWLLWLTLEAVGAASPARHALVCAALAAGTAAPWFASLLLPDIFAPVTVLCVFVLAWHPALSGPRRWGVWLLATLAIAAHLSHLLVAAACVAVVALVRAPLLPAAGLPLAAALGLLVASNVIGFGRVAVSPFGSVFALARLVADGPARARIDTACPAAGYALCAWAGRLPTDSDTFLWSAEGPVWSTPGGPMALAPEAARIVADSIAAYPWAVAAAAAANTARQLGRTRLGDTLGPDWLDATVGLRLRTFFPAAEQARFAAGRQLRGELAAVAAPLAWPHAILLVAGAGATLLLAVTRRGPIGGLAALALVGLAANAFATGALSGPHDRYQARIAWLVVLVPLAYAASLATSSGGRRTSRS